MAGDVRQSDRGVGGGVGPSRRKFLAAGTSAAGAVLLNAVSERAVADEDNHGPKARPTCVAVDPKGEYVFASDDKGRLIRYNLAQNPPRLTTRQVYNTKHGGKASYVAVAGDKVLTAGYDGIVLIHDRADVNQAATPFNKHISGNSHPEVWIAILSKNADRALSATNDGKILLWDIGNLSVISEFDDSSQRKMKTGPVGGLAFVPPIGPDDKETEFLSTHGRGLINHWKINSSRPFDEYSHKNPRAVNSVAITGGYFVTGGFDQTVRLWKFGNKDPIKRFRNHESWVWRVAISPSGLSAISSADDKTAQVWNINPASKDEKVVHTLTGNPNGVMGAAFIKDGLVVLAHNDSDTADELSLQAVP